ncbi:MAG TPA: NADH:ubiquinone oxidoreductase [Bacteroidales bacterium]|nr:NADH:ubiquinone oxidoreductase [Bacteroidales bacterium]
MCRIEITDRTRYIRSIIGELERIHSHLLWLGLAGHFLGYNTVFMWAWKYREPILDLFEMITGNRNSYAMFKVGGVRRDIEESKIPVILKAMSDIKKKLTLLTGAVMDDPVIHARTKGVGVLTKQDVIDYGAVGPTARASGLAIDIRKDDPYAAYPLVNWKVITSNTGDVFAKTEVRLMEMFESVSIIEQCLEKIKKEKEGDISIKVKEIPEGMGTGRAEAPRGEVFHCVFSDGSNSPVRHKIRAPSYVNIATFKKSCIGQSISDATITLAAVDPCYCCTERLAAAYDAGTGLKIHNARELIEMSVSKTTLLRKQQG